MAQRFSIDAIFRAIDQVTDPVRKIARNVNRASERMERSLGKVNGAIGRISGGARQVGTAVAAGAAVAGAGLAHVITKGADFEQTLVNAGSKFSEPIDRGTAAFERLGKAALGVSSTTEFSASEAAGAIDFMAKAGESASVAMGSLGTFADLASVAQVDLATAADLASDSIGPLGLATDDQSKKAERYAKTADLMAKTTNMANLGFEDLFESIKAGSGPFRAAGQDAEQFLASLALLAGEGNKGSKAGKDLARVMARITDTATKAPKALKQLGIAVSDKDGNIRDFLDIMTDFQAKLSKLSEIKQAQKVTDVFGANSKAAGVTILNNLDKARVFEEKLAEASGFTAEVAAKSRDTALGKIKTFWSTIESIVISIFGVIKEDVEKVVTAMTAWANKNKEVFSETVQKAIQFIRDNFERMAAVGPRLIKLTVALAAMAKTLTIVQSVLAVVAATTAVAAGSMGLIAIGVLAAVAALVLLVVFWDDVVQVAADAWAGLVLLVSDIGQMILAGWKKWFGDPLKALWEEMPAGIKDAFASLGEFFTGLWAGIVSTFNAAIEPIMAKIRQAKDLASGLFGSDDEEDTSKRKENVTIGSLRAAESKTISAFEIEQTAAFVDVPTPERFFPEIPEANIPAAANSAPAATDTPAPPPPAVSPDVINTTSSEIARVVTESIQSTKVDINLKDPGGAVESVDQTGEGDSVKVQRTAGDI